MLADDPIAHATALAVAVEGLMATGLAGVPPGFSRLCRACARSSAGYSTKKAVAAQAAFAYKIAKALGTAFIASLSICLGRRSR
ncbi:MAG: hypothetical protein ACLP9L_13180 [Thermoguttaceae bacterium]